MPRSSASCVAVAEAEGLGGEDLILAIVIAYELQMRFQDAACLFRRGWDHVNFVTIAESIRVDTTDVGFKFLAKDKAKWRPTTRETADHSLPYTVARAFFDGTITRASYDPSRLADPEVLRLIDKITVQEDPVLAANMPSLANRVTVMLKTGEVLSEQFGTKENPRTGLADAAIETKFRDFAEDRFSAERVNRTLDLCWTLDRQTDLQALVVSLALD